MKKRFLRRLGLFFFAACFLLGSLTVPAYGMYNPPFEIQAQSAIVVDLSSGEVVYELNADAPVQPAMLTGMMTTILTLESGMDLDNTTGTMKQYIQDTLYQSGAYLGGFLLNEEAGLRKLCYAVMLQSACDAAMMIADTVGDGSQAYFVEQMNKKAQEIGAQNTTFTTAYGRVEEGSTTTARDMASIAQYAMEVPGFMEIAGTASYDGGPTNQHETLYWNSQNSLLVPGHQYYYQGVTGLKSSFDTDAGRSLVATCSSGGVSYLVVLMGVPAYDDNGERLEENLAFTQAADLFDWLYSTFKIKTVVEQGKNITEVPLKFCWGQDYLRLMSAERFTALMPVDVEASSVTYRFHLPQAVAAPVERGEVVGTAELVLANEVLGEIDLVATETVDRNLLLYALGGLASLYSHFWFKYAVVFLVLLGAFYTFVMVMRNKNKERYRSVRHRKRL